MIIPGIFITLSMRTDEKEIAKVPTFKTTPVALTTGFRVGCLGGTGICQIEVLSTSAKEPESGLLKGKAQLNNTNRLVLIFEPDGAMPADRAKCLESGRFEVPVDHRVNSDVLHALGYEKPVYWIKAGNYPVRLLESGQYEIQF